MGHNDLIRRQWNQASESWVDFVRGGKDYYREYMNGPALIRMMGDVRGKQVLDIGCGEGYFSRVFADMGAKVTGVDFSETLIEAALEEELRKPLGVKYLISNAADLIELQSSSFDIAFCFMSLMDIQDYEAAIAEASRVLKEGGRFVIVIPHPCFGEWTGNGEIVSGWETRIKEDGTKEFLYYYIYDYLQRRVETVAWDFERLTSSFVTTSYHRTLSDYINKLSKYGLAITGLDEPEPSEEGPKVHLSLRRHFRVPHSIVIEATKIPMIERVLI